MKWWGLKLFCQNCTWEITVFDWYFLVFPCFHFPTSWNDVQLKFDVCGQSLTLLHPAIFVTSTLLPSADLSISFKRTVWRFGIWKNAFDSSHTIWNFRQLTCHRFYGECIIHDVQLYIDRFLVVIAPSRIHHSLHSWPIIKSQLIPLSFRQLKITFAKFSPVQFTVG